MTEVTIRIPEDIKDIIDGITEPLYVEALREIARKRFAYNKKKLKDYRKKIAIFEAKYGKSYEDFSQSVPDTVKGHDDWIEWSYLIKVTNELSAKIEKLRLLIGK
ncbi:MAG TPA: hypothetical protein C5S37_12015 [Methanophagales archaeon]|nr:hypothetical protein [Methanophagales archaeon]HJH27454.1 hypothetical protein [Methanophagales archaeon]